MGIDLLDIHFRLERKLGLRLTRLCLVLDRMTTVGELIEQLTNRLNGWDAPNLEEVRDRLRELDAKLLYEERSCGVFAWMRGQDLDNPLEKEIAASKREGFWESLKQVARTELPPLRSEGQIDQPQFPPELNTRRKVWQHLRRIVRGQLNWVPAEPEPAQSDSSPPWYERWARLALPWSGAGSGTTLATAEAVRGLDRPPPPSSEEIRRIVYETLVDCLGVEMNEIRDDAELMADLGAD